MSRILVIDDNAANRARLRTILTDAGHTVEEAVNGVEGLSRVHAVSFDLVITDMVMPVMNGYAFMKRLRADPDPKIATLPALFCTAVFPHLGAVELSRAAGTQGVISSTAESLLIVQAVNETLASQPRDLPTQPPTPQDRLEALIADLEAHGTTK